MNDDIHPYTGLVQEVGEGLLSRYRWAIGLAEREIESGYANTRWGAWRCVGKAIRRHQKPRYSESRVIPSKAGQ